MYLANAPRPTPPPPRAVACHHTPNMLNTALATRTGMPLCIAFTLVARAATYEVGDNDLP